MIWSWVYLVLIGHCTPTIDINDDKIGDCGIGIAVIGIGIAVIGEFKFDTFENETDKLFGWDRLFVFPLPLLLLLLLTYSKKHKQIHTKH